MRDNKWESNENGGALWVDMADGTPVFVAEALGATVSVKAHRAAFIAKACNEHDTLKAKADLFDELREYVTRQSISDDSVVIYSAKILRKVEDILSKAKELK
jgi:hypothetical protein